ncbi:hypothetical protein [Algoriphagus yeomjeoni]|uniref:Uncharacterized protein n=1 Tax=Algoriphagus yeomjeoni TaxID=291403 RepID=A0A327P302_9BACT|nr:hypothetical protein [Algoriphagus yeomjeoni]RAI86689.1 hypothetical protein LV83_03245 [Algoriphagus yeomjeoni]
MALSCFCLVDWLGYAVSFSGLLCGPFLECFLLVFGVVGDCFFWVSILVIVVIVFCTYGAPFDVSIGVGVDFVLGLLFSMAYFVVGAFGFDEFSNLFFLFDVKGRSIWFGFLVFGVVANALAADCFFLVIFGFDFVGFLLFLCFGFFCIG